MTKDAQAPMKLIHLIGDSEETFYQLGLKDKSSFLPLFNQTRNLIQVNFKFLDSLIDEILNWGGLCLTYKASSFRKKVRAYNEAIGLKEREMLSSFLIPEVLSCLSKWIPGLSPRLFGCSSFFMLNEKGEPLHGRILDFPLAEVFDSQERALKWDLPNLGNQLFSYSSSGFPFSSLTSMNSYGVSVAIHQKYTNVFNIKGTPIFELVEEMLLKCGDKKSVLDFLENNQSLTTWGLYIGFKNGDVLEADLCGQDLYTKEYKLKENKILYFNNISLEEEEDLYYIPFGMKSFCEMREKSAEKIISNFLKSKAEKTSLNLLQLMSTPLEQKKEIKDWNLSPINHSSISCSTFNPKSGESLFIPGPSPKYLRSSVTSFENIWERIKQKPIKIPQNKKIEFTSGRLHQGMREMMMAQTAYDKHDYHMAYHYIQASIETLYKLPERYISKFFFAVFEFIHEPHRKARGLILQEFKDLRDKLPTYLNDHCLLFINRLQVLISGFPT
ncbi:MAG: hypothetical protein VYD54_14380, partial [Bdellovibrionota bacterium]|nr:hypothetical protein [Bdellovibrionota bacterium]